MWLKSHSNCPICRAIVEGGSGSGLGSDDVAGGLSLDGPGYGSEVEVVVAVLGSGQNENRVEEMVDSSQVVALGDSFKRLLSRNRSEHKAHSSASYAQAMN